MSTGRVLKVDPRTQRFRNHAGGILRRGCGASSREQEPYQIHYLHSCLEQALGNSEDFHLAARMATPFTADQLAWLGARLGSRSSPLTSPPLALPPGEGDGPQLGPSEIVESGTG